MRALFIASILALLAWPAAGQPSPRCLTLDQFSTILARVHGEVPVSVLIIETDDQDVEARMFATPDGSTWTLAIRDENGCWQAALSGHDHRPIGWRPS